jgi:hypothetical protein
MPRVSFEGRLPARRTISRMTGWFTFCSMRAQKLDHADTQRLQPLSSPSACMRPARSCWRSLDALRALSSLAVSSWSLFVREAFSAAFLASARLRRTSIFFCTASARWRRASRLFCAAADARRVALRSARTRGFLTKAVVRLAFFRAASRPTLAQYASDPYVGLPMMAERAGQDRAQTTAGARSEGLYIEKRQRKQASKHASNP